MEQDGNNDRCGTNGTECSTGEGIFSAKCATWMTFFKSCPVIRDIVLNGEVTPSAIHACKSMGDSECEIRKEKVKEEV